MTEVEKETILEKYRYYCALLPRSVVLMFFVVAVVVASDVEYCYVHESEANDD